MSPRRQQHRIWIVLPTEYKSEGVAARSLKPLVLETYNPLWRERPKTRGRQHATRKILPVLMGYILARIDRRATVLGELARAKGVKGDPLGRVQDHEIEHLRSLEDNLGYVSLEGDEPPAFAFGESVLALSGMFKDQTGEYRGLDWDNPRRARVAFEILSRVQEISVPRFDLARVA